MARLSAFFFIPNAFSGNLRAVAGIATGNGESSVQSFGNAFRGTDAIPAFLKGSPKTLSAAY